MDKTALSYWFPKIEAAGLPVPRTTIIKMPTPAAEDVGKALDGEDGNGALRPFCDELRAAMAPMGFPCFLRTDLTSGKHEWKRTCFVADPVKVESHVIAIAEFSECASLIGMPWNTWVVREFLPTKPMGICPFYRDMPVCREFRFFVDGPQVECWHPYWPKNALEIGGAEGIDHDALCRTADEAQLRVLASLAGEAVGGRWSVDILETERGWFVTDMAEADKSFHWEECPRAGS